MARKNKRLDLSKWEGETSVGWNEKERPYGSVQAESRAKAASSGAKEPPKPSAELTAAIQGNTSATAPSSAATGTAPGQVATSSTVTGQAQPSSLTPEQQAFITANKDQLLDALRGGAQYMQAVTAKPQGYFESQGTTPYTKEVGKTVDSGLHWLSNLFNTEDEADLEIAGVNLAPVESVFDDFMRGMNWAYDRWSQVRAWGVSAMPGGLDTYSWDQANNVSVGQTAVTDAAQRTNQMEGSFLGPAGSMLSGLPNFVIGGGVGGILGTVASFGDNDMAPFAEEGFDIHDPEARKAAFEESEVGKWMSGMTDVTEVVVADPLIFGGKILKLGRIRFLDAPIRNVNDTARVVENLKESKRILQIAADAQVDEAGSVVRPGRQVEDLTPEEVQALRLPEEGRLAWEAIARVETPKSRAAREAIDAIEDPAERAARQAAFQPQYTKRVPEATLYNHQVLAEATNRGALVQAVRNADTFDEAELVLRHAAGDLRASRELNRLAPHLYAHVINGERNLLSALLRANPEIAAKEVERLDKVRQSLQKRIDDLEVLRADGNVIAQHRDELDRVISLIDEAGTGTVQPVGVGVNATKEEIDLMRRSLDRQIEHNNLFFSVLENAKGDPNSSLFRALAGRSKGFSRFGEEGTSILPGKAGQVSERLDAAVGTMVQNSRMRRAAAKAAAEMGRGQAAKAARQARQAARADGTGTVGAIKAGFIARVQKEWEIAEFYGMDAGGHSLAALNRFNPVARVFRWAGTEKPAGLIHHAGITADESEREVRALVNSIDLYTGKAVQGKDKYGRDLWRNKNGTITATPEKGAEPFMVGGQGRREEIVQMYQNALLKGGIEGGADMRKLLADIEEQFIIDISAAHGLDVDQLRQFHYSTSGKLTKIEKDIIKDRYWIEKGETTKNYAPFLDTHLQNQFFVKNWKQIENSAALIGARNKTLRPQAGINESAAYAKERMERFAVDRFNAFNANVQSVWRPMVLVRPGYTARNLLEGMFRSSAFTFSLAPVFNAARQAGLSTVNVGKKVAGVNARAQKVVTRAQKGATLDQMPPKFQRWHAVQKSSVNAEAEALRNLIDEGRRMLETNPAYRTARSTRLNDDYAHILTDTAALRDEVRLLEVQRAEFLSGWPARRDKIVDKMSKGKELTKQEEAMLEWGDLGLSPAEQRLIDKAEAVLVRNDERLEVVTEELRRLTELNAIGGTGTPTDVVTEMVDAQMRNLDDLEYGRLPEVEGADIALDDMTIAALHYARQSTAKLRTYGKQMPHITDADTMASIMRNRALADAFDPQDPYTDLALQNLSAGGTMQQTAALRVKAVNDGLVMQNMNYYVDVNPLDPEYADGVATAANQFQNSDIGEIVIRGRFEEKTDAEIVDEVVRYLYETDRGQDIAAWLNEAFEIGSPERFAAHSERRAEALVARAEKSGPLYDRVTETQAALRSARMTAVNARRRLPQPRWTGDSPTIPKRKWEGNRYGDYSYSKIGKGQYEIRDSVGGVLSRPTNEAAARKTIREMSTADDDLTRAHWTLDEPIEAGGAKFGSEADIDNWLAAKIKERDDAKKAFDAEWEKPLEIKRPPKGVYNTKDLEDAREYAAEVIRRYDIITSKSRPLQELLATTKQLPMTGGQAGDMIRPLLFDADGNPLPGLELNPVIGNMAELVGTQDYMNMVQKASGFGFKWFGTVPEDLFVRAPFYGKQFRKQAQEAYDSVVAQLGGEEFVTSREINMIREFAHRSALKDTKKWLYTIDRRTSFASVAENFVPFASATQNSVTVLSKMIWRDPSILGVMRLMWQAPDRAGWTENDIVFVPVGWLPDNVEEVIGAEDGKLAIPKKSFDLLLQGIMDAGSTPILSMGSSELMKHGLWGMYTSETPPWLEPLGGLGDFLWTEWKNYTLGEGFGASTYPMSIDKVLSPAGRRAFDLFVQGPGSSAAYGSLYDNIRMTEERKFKDGIRDSRPTHDEIIQRTNMMMGARAFGSWVYPFAPKYDIKNRELLNDMRLAEKAWYDDQDRIKALEYQQKQGMIVDPDDLQPKVMHPYELYGDAMWRASKLQTTRNNAGIPMNNEGMQFIQKNPDLIESLAGQLQDADSLDMLGMFVENSDDSYDPNMKAWMIANDVPGLGTPFMDILDPTEAEHEADKRIAWHEYLREKDLIDIEMQQQGVKSYNSKEGHYYDLLKEDLKKKIIARYPDVGLDFDDPDGKRAGAAVTAITLALNDPTFQKQRAADPVWQRGGIANQYVEARERYMSDMQQIWADMQGRSASMEEGVPYSKTAKAAGPWQDLAVIVQKRWDETRFELQKNPSWSYIADRYIGDDDMPGEIAYDIMNDTQFEEAS